MSPALRAKPRSSGAQRAGAGGEAPPSTRRRSPSQFRRRRRATPTHPLPAEAPTWPVALHSTPIQYPDANQPARPAQIQEHGGGPTPHPPAIRAAAPPNLAGRHRTQRAPPLLDSGKDGTVTTIRLPGPAPVLRASRKQPKRPTERRHRPTRRRLGVEPVCQRVTAMIAGPSWPVALFRSTRQPRSTSPQSLRHWPCLPG